MRRLSLVLGLVLLSACNLDVATTPDQPTDPAKETFASSLNIDISQMTKTADGDYYKDLKVGSGDALTAPGPVDMEYAGYLKTGALFDQGTLTQFDLRGSVVGLQDGMIGMRAGGERVIVIPSELGYGSTPVGSIPPNSTLVFDVALQQVY